MNISKSRSVAILCSALATASFATACRQPTSQASATSAAVSREESGAVAAPGVALYPLSLELRDQDGAKIGLDVFRGHPVIVSMFYGSCPTACPMLISHVKRLEASLDPEVRATTRVLLVSFDPERDTPAVMRELATAHRVDTSRWRLAAGPDHQVRQLANAIGVSYRNDGDGMFSHNSVVAVLDADGRVVARTEEPRTDVLSLGIALARSAR
jgi:protein SCO1/2